MTFYKLSDLKRNVTLPGQPPAEGHAIQGQRMEVRYYRYPPSAGHKPHAHAEEQVMMVMKGQMRSRVAGEQKILGPGEAVYIAANVEHESWSVGEEVEFINLKAVVTP